MPKSPELKPRHFLPYRARKIIQRSKRLILNAVLNPLLASSSGSPPSFLNDDQVNRLDAKFQAGGSYGYDEKAKRQRACSRMKQIAGAVPVNGFRDVMELGGGDGQLSLKFHQDGVRAIILDIDDWRDDEVKNAGVQIRQVVSDQSLPVADGEFDLVFSFNTMEHVPDPAETMSELVRAVRPGGWLYLNFGPLFNSPLGLHAYRTTGIPYVQFLASREYLQQFIDARGINDLGVDRTQF